MHIFVTELNDFTLLDISYKTHPDYKLVEAVYESCSVPIVFSPLIKENFCNIDGGLITNYPLDNCIENVENTDEILGVLKAIDYDKQVESKISNDITFLDFIMKIINSLIKKIVRNSLKNHKEKIKNQCIINTEPLSIMNIINILSCSDERKKMIKRGEEYCAEFIEKMS